MKQRDLLYWLVLVIAALTAVSGLAQMIMPGFVLSRIGGEGTAASRHFFGIIGMFMLLFGGALLHELLSASSQPIVVLWTGLQKLGASAAVTLGVSRSTFSTLALLVAGFDFLSAVLVLSYWGRVRRPQ